MRRKDHSNGADLKTGRWTTRATAESWESEAKCQQLKKTTSGKSETENLPCLDILVQTIVTKIKNKNISEFSCYFFIIIFMYKVTNKF